MKKKLSVIITLLMLIGLIANIGTIDANAADNELTPVDYTFGEVYEGVLDNQVLGTGETFMKCFRITISNNQHIVINMFSERDMPINIYDSSGNCVSNDSNSIVKERDDGSGYDTRHSCNLQAGTFNIKINEPNRYSGTGNPFTFVATAEPIISLGTPVISSLQSQAGGQFTVNCNAVSNALGYEYQYATDPEFSSPEVKTSPSASYTATNLENGKYYYVRVRAYFAYSDGLKVYSNWCIAQSVFIPCAEHLWDNGAVVTAASCTSSGSKLYTCTVCGQTKTVTSPALGHQFELIDYVAATYNDAGNIAYQYCSRCEKAFDISDNPAEIDLASTVIPRKKVVQGANISVASGTYKVISKKSRTLMLIKAKNKKSVSIPSTITLENKKYKVTTLGSKAFTGKKIRTVTIGKNVKVIKKNAFRGSKANKIILKTKLLKKAKIKGCLSGSKVKTVKVNVGSSQNKKYVKSYKKIFTKKNVGKKVTLQ